MPGTSVTVRKAAIANANDLVKAKKWVEEATGLPFEGKDGQKAHGHHGKREECRGADFL